MLGMCPTLAVTVSAINGIAMALATTFVLIFSSLFISLLRKLIPDQVRIAAYIVIIASFVTVVDLVMKAQFPDLSKALGPFIPLIVVNCIILGRAEAFASKNNPLLSALDALGNGLGFLLILFFLGGIREIIGSGTLLGFQVFSQAYDGVIVFKLPAGGFLTLGLIFGAVNYYYLRKKSLQHKTLIQQLKQSDQIAPTATTQEA